MSLAKQMLSIKRIQENLCVLATSVLIDLPHGESSFTRINPSGHLPELKNKHKHGALIIVYDFNCYKYRQKK